MRSHSIVFEKGSRFSFWIVVLAAATAAAATATIQPTFAEEKHPPGPPGHLGGPPSKERFQEHKKEVLSDLDARLQLIQSEKDCISSAADPQAMHKCRDSARAEQDKLREAHKKKNMNRLDEQIRRLQDQKKRMESEGHGPPPGPGGSDASGH